MIKNLSIVACMGLLALSAAAQTTNSSSQVGAGSAGSLTPKGVKPAPDKQHQLLNSALTPKTRQTLQDAMNSEPQSPAPGTPSSSK